MWLHGYLDIQKIERKIIFTMNNMFWIVPVCFKVIENYYIVATKWRQFLEEFWSQLRCHHIGKQWLHSDVTLTILAIRADIDIRKHWKEILKITLNLNITKVSTFFIWLYLSYFWITDWPLFIFYLSKIFSLFFYKFFDNMRTFCFTYNLLVILCIKYVFCLNI